MKKKQNTRAAGTYTEAALGEEGEDACGFAGKCVFYSPHKAMKCELGPMRSGGSTEYETSFKAEELERLPSE